MPIENIDDIIDQMDSEPEDDVELDQEESEESDAPRVVTTADLEDYGSRIIDEVVNRLTPQREERQVLEEEPDDWQKIIDERVQRGIDKQMQTLGPALAGVMARNAVGDIAQKHGISETKVKEIMATLPPESLGATLRHDAFWANQASIAKTRTRTPSAGGHDDSPGAFDDKMDRALAAEFRTNVDTVRKVTKGSR